MNYGKHAKQLGIKLGQSDVFKAMKRAEDNVEKNEDLKEFMQEGQRLTDRAMGMQARGMEVTPELVIEIEEMKKKIQGYREFATLLAAQTAFAKMMDEVNRGIAEGIKDGAKRKIIV